MGRTRSSSVLCGALLVGALGIPAFGQTTDPAIEELKRQVQQAQEALRQQQAVIEALQGRIADLEKSKSGAVTQAELKAQVAAEVKRSAPDALKGLKVGTTTFLSFQNGNGWSGTKNETRSYSAFTVKRAYVEVRWDLTPWLTARVTPDIYGTTLAGGQYTVRPKYAYASFHWKGNGFFDYPFVEAGMIRTPWIDFEEQLNRYRTVEATYLDRNGIMASADLGIEAGSNFGPELDAAYRKDVNDRYDGRWGSWALGLYNGGGYTNAERNQNKVFQWRLSIRPFGEVVPTLTGLQVQWAGSRGSGNVAPNTSAHPVIDPPDLTANYGPHLPVQVRERPGQMVPRPGQHGGHGHRRHLAGRGRPAREGLPGLRGGPLPREPDVEPSSARTASTRTRTNPSSSRRTSRPTRTWAWPSGCSSRTPSSWTTHGSSTPSPGRASPRVRSSPSRTTTAGSSPARSSFRRGRCRHPRSIGSRIIEAGSSPRLAWKGEGL